MTISRFGLWGTWSSCSTCCGSYTSKRTRTCSDGQCSETLSEEETRTTEAGLRYKLNVINRFWYLNSNSSSWESWSTCSKTCGSGVISRTRTCASDSCTFIAEGGKLREECPCNIVSNTCQYCFEIVPAKEIGNAVVILKNNVEIDRTPEIGSFVNIHRTCFDSFDVLNDIVELRHR